MTDPAKLERWAKALEALEQIVVNGVELGFIRMPETSMDTAHLTLPAIRQALSEIRAEAEAGEQSGWRPISTAPLDGTHIILAFGQDVVAEGWWEDADPGAHPWKFIDQGCAGSPFVNGELLNGAREVRGGPTHWQPLPASPSPGEGR